MTHTIKAITATLALILTIDAFGFFAWIMSGQVPADNYYLGTLTAHVLRALLFQP